MLLCDYILIRLYIAMSFLNIANRADDMDTKSQSIIGLQAGSNKGASQKGFVFIIKDVQGMQ